MSDIENVFRPHDPSKPRISINFPSKEELIAQLLGLIPGYRALKNFQDNPEGPISETLDLAAEDLVPLYAALIKPAIKGGDVDAEQALKEAAIFGIPLPYTRFPKGHFKAGEPIPNNLREGLGTSGWGTAKFKLKRGERKLYADPNNMLFRGSTDGGLSTRSRVNATANTRDVIDVPAGPYRETNTGSDMVNQGRQAMNTNTKSRKSISGQLKGSQGWQGDMYPPGRSLAKLNEYGPYVWDKASDQTEYIRKLNNVINENENKWEYLINKTRSRNPDGTAVRQSAIVPKDDIVSIAMNQGRPDIAARVITDNEPRMSVLPGTNNFNPRFSSYRSQQKSMGKIPDDAKWKDIGNRQVEKELREQFAMLPEDDLIREKFADYYGVPDLYNDWKANPEYWKEFRNETANRRYVRKAANRLADRKYGRTIKR